MISFCFVFCHDLFFFFKQKTAYEMRISDWSSDVCSSDLAGKRRHHALVPQILRPCLELLRRRADLFAKLHQRIAQRMRVEIGQASRCERLTEYIADWPGTLPAFATAKANRRKAAIFAKAEIGRAHV